MGLMDADEGVADRDLAATIDAASWSAYQKALLACLALVFAVDGLANQSLGIALPALIADWGVQRAAFAPVTAANLGGVALGSVLGGMLGDRIGRRWVLIGAIFLFGLMTAASGLAQDSTQLLIIRFFDGIGIGSAIPNGAVLITEFTPARRRGRAIAIGMVFIPIGGIIAGGLGVLVLSVLGWQSLFFIAGALPILLAVAFSMFLPESPSFLLGAGRHDELRRLMNRCGIHCRKQDRFIIERADATDVPLLRVLLSPTLWRGTLLLWASFFTCLMASYTIFSWVPTMLHTLGFGLTMASVGIMTFHGGGVIGALYSGVLLDKRGFSFAHISLAAAASVIAALLTLMLGVNLLSAAVILPMMLALGFCIAGLHNTLYTLAATTYPTTARATGVGTASAVGRLGAVLSSFTGVLSLDLGGSAAFFGCIATLLALCGLCGVRVRTGIRFHLGPGPDRTDLQEPALVRGRVGYTAANNRFNIAQAEVTGGVRADEV